MKILKNNLMGQDTEILKKKSLFKEKWFIGIFILIFILIFSLAFLFIIHLSKEDISFCDEFGNESIKKDCKVCLKSNDLVNCKDLIYGKIAVLNEDILLCDKLTPDQKNICLYEVNKKIRMSRLNLIDFKSYTYKKINGSVVKIEIEN